MYALIVHGGAGAWKLPKKELAVSGVTEAATVGQEVLARGGSALEAAVRAVVMMEDDPVFNAGTGSSLNLDGEAEMDAGVMVGQGLLTGNVTCIRRVRNPVLVAQKVLEQTDHVLLAREGALRFARAMGFPDYDPVTHERLAEWHEKRQALARGDRNLPRRLRELFRHGDLAQGTVGAVALDRKGELVAATSTGGVTLKLSGRIGDTPIPGAGNYATPRCAASATGRGELMMRFLTTKAVCDRVAMGKGPQEAVDETLAAMAGEVGKEAGVIALDAGGRMGIGHLTPAMAYAFIKEGGWVRSGIRYPGQ